MSKWTFYHPVVFCLTFFSHAFFHAVRKTLSNVKSTLTDEWTPSGILYVNDDNVAVPQQQHCTPYVTWTRDADFFQERDDVEEFLGAMDAVFLFAYAAGLYVAGFIADRQDLRKVLSLGMMSTAVVVFVIGPVLRWTGVNSEPAYLVLMVVNGLLQSAGWPCVVSVMGNWFGKNSRGFVLGLWASCASVGNIIGSLVVSSVVDYGYEYAFLLTSCMLFAFGILIFVGLVPNPREVGLPMADEEGEEEAEEEGKDVKDTRGDKLMDMVYVVGHEVGKDHEKAVEAGLSLATDAGVGVGVGVEMTAVIGGESQLEKLHGASSGVILDAVIKGYEPSGTTDGFRHSPAVAAENSVSNGFNRTELDNEKYNLYMYNRTDRHNGFSSSSSSPPQVSVGDNGDDAEETSRPQAVGFLTALLLPGVIPYSLAYAFLKLVNYAFFSWLPFYLSSAYGWREATADQLSTWYDVGGVVGGTVAGFVSDRCCGKRAVVVVPMLTAGIPMLYVYGSVSAGGEMLINAVMLTCTGVLIGGVANLISAAIAADLGRQDAIRGSSKALSTVTGIVDGSGSMGAAIGQVAVPYLQVAFGWKSVFYLFMAAVSLTVACLLPILAGELKDAVTHFRRGGKAKGAVK